MGFVKSTLHQNWLLALVILVLLSAAAVLRAMPDKKATADEGRPAQVLPGGDPIIVASKRDVDSHPVRPTTQEAAQKTIDDLNRQLMENPKADDAPALLYSMANLNRQKLGKYKEAARLYELILIDYSQWESIPKVYPQLATCYQRLNDTAAEQGVYRRMTEKFPPESQEYLYGQTQLGLM